MRINKFGKPWKWLPTFTAMPRMIRELERRPESGFLDAAHWPAWVAFNKRVGSDGDVGIWHETYLVASGRYECVYNNMPPTGLGATAASRAGIRDEEHPTDAPTERISV
jgi:Monooxygenase af470-like